MTTRQGTLLGIDGQPSVDDAREQAQVFVDAMCSAGAGVIDGVAVDAALLDAMPVGPALAALLASGHPALLAPDAQLAFAAATERLAAWVQSLQNTALVAYAGPAPRITHYDVVGRVEELVDVRRSHLARRLLWSESMAHRRITTARTLHASLPQCADALSCGELSGLRAVALVESARALTSRIDAVLDVTAAGVERDDLVAARRCLLTAFEAKAVSYACGHDLSRTRSRARAVAAHLDPEGLAWRRARAARDLTAVGLRHDEDCLSTLQATMPSELAIECLHAIDGVADDASRIEQELPAGVRRAHALHGLLTGALPNGWRQEGARTALAHEAPVVEAAPTPDSHGVRHGRMAARLNVTLDLATLLALRAGTAQLDGVGPMPAEVARRLAASPEAAIRWLVTDDTGELLDISPRRYRIGTALRALITSRDGTCAEPHCSTPAERCEIDHVVPFDRGGTSTPENLQPRCKRHHQVKTHGEPMPAARVVPRAEPLPHVVPSSQEVDAARELVNECHRNHERNVEYGVGTEGTADAMASARVASFAASAAERTRNARRLLSVGPLGATFSFALGLYGQRPKPLPAHQPPHSSRAHREDDLPPF